MFPGFPLLLSQEVHVGMELATWMKLSSTVMRGKQDFQRRVIQREVLEV